MGSTMKKSIFDQQTKKALMSWHKNALNKKKTDGKPAPTAIRTLGGNQSHESPESSPVHPNSRVETATTISSSPRANIVASVDIDGGELSNNNHLQ